jgi:hypothetical protein
MTTAIKNLMNFQLASPQNHIRNAAVTVVENLLMGRKVVSNGKHCMQLILSYHEGPACTMSCKCMHDNYSVLKNAVSDNTL